MKKIFSVFFALLFCAASVFAASATKNIHILIDTGKSMRNDGISKRIYQSVGGYVARFVDEHHNDKFGKNVNIVIEGVVKHKNGPLLLTVPYVNRKPGSRLDLSAIGEMNPNPPDWMTSWDLDPNPTNLDLFQTHFFDKANTSEISLGNLHIVGLGYKLEGFKIGTRLKHAAYNSGSYGYRIHKSEQRISRNSAYRKNHKVIYYERNI